jgi:predicted pyridoxine 5'-phosphate oxidase superfamily flavin-nucleotide-binding protein
MARLEGRAGSAFRNIHFFKFAATVSGAGAPNVVPLLSARSVDPETIAFVRFMVWKTAKNFEANKKITFACIGPWGKAYLAKGEFMEWQTKGPLLEQFENEAMYRYNAYTGANMLGVVKVREVLQFPGGGVVGPMLSSLGSRLGGAKARAASADGGPMPVQVVEKWGRPLAAKFIGMVDEQGDPLAFPMMGMRAQDAGALVFPMPRDMAHPLNRLKEGAMLAASVFTLEPVAYQVKGQFAGEARKAGDRFGVVKVSEVYTAAPPVPGRRIYPPEQGL